MYKLMNLHKLNNLCSQRSNLERECYQYPECYQYHVASCYHLPTGHHSPFRAWEHLCLSLKWLLVEDNTAQALLGCFFYPVFLFIHIVGSAARFSSLSTWEETLISGHSAVDRITSMTFVCYCSRFL